MFDCQRASHAASPAADRLPPSSADGHTAWTTPRRLDGPRYALDRASQQRRAGHSLLWLIIAVAIFGTMLVPVVLASTSSRQSMYARQRALERTMEAHRLARWASARPPRMLKTLPADLSAALPSDWQGAVDAQLAPPAGMAASDALAGATLHVAIQRDVDGKEQLHRVKVKLETPDRVSIVVERLVTLR